MKSVYIYIILLIAVVAAFYYLFGDIFTGEPARVRSGHLIDIEPDNIQKGIYIKNDSTRIMFERSGKGWVVTHPIRTAGALNILDDLIDDISRSKIREVIEEPENLSDFGLEDPFCVIILYSDDRPSPDTIRVGARAPTSYLRYTSIGSSADVYLSSEIISETAEKTLFHFRNKKFININPHFINRMEFISGSREFAVTETDSGWKLEDTGIMARENYIQGVLQTLDRMLIYRFIPGTDRHFRNFGLDSPSYTILIDSYEKNIRFRFGDRMADMIYAARDDIDQIFLVRTDILRIFSERYEFIFRMDVSDFDQTAAERICIRAPGRELELVSGEKGWQESGGGPSRDELARSLLATLSTLEFSDLPSAFADEKELEADISITLEGSGSEMPERFLFYDIEPGRVDCWSSSSGGLGPVPAEKYSAILSALRGL